MNVQFLKQGKKRKQIKNLLGSHSILETRQINMTFFIFETRLKKLIALNKRIKRY